MSKIGKFELACRKLHVMVGMCSDSIPFCMTDRDIAVVMGVSPRQAARYVQQLRLSGRVSQRIEMVFYGEGLCYRRRDLRYRLPENKVSRRRKQRKSRPTPKSRVPFDNQVARIHQFLILGGSGVRFMTDQEFSARLGVSRRQVSRLLQSLKKDGAIVSKINHRFGNIFYRKLYLAGELEREKWFKDNEGICLNG